MASVEYKPNIFMYYGIKGDNEYKITPAPNMTIAVNMRYSSDTVIGYNYTVTLNGTVTSLNLQNLGYGDSYDPETMEHGNIGSLVDAIARLRELLLQNGNILYITNAQDNSILFKARNGKLVSFDVSPSNDNWRQTAPFTATIEFDTIEINETEDCSTPFFDSPISEYAIGNLAEYKLKSFNDNWTFDFPESAYNKLANTDANKFINVNNVIFTIQYQIQATGSDYFVYTNDEVNSDAKATPAWSQAKAFAQKRLHGQVTNLINKVLKTYPDACSSTDGLADINIPGTSGLLSSLGDLDYIICNETVNCQSSESEGTFSATYNAMVCSRRGGFYSSPLATHTIQKNTTQSNELIRPEKRITLSGSIQGMIEGGLVRTNEPLELPANGSFIIKRNQVTTKYMNARTLLNRFFDATDYNGGIGTHSKIDLKQGYKDLFGINQKTLGITPAPDDQLSDSLPHPVNFSLTEDKSAGIINYTVEYSDIANRCGKKYTSINIESEEPLKVHSVIEIPNGGCAVVQKLGTYSARKINVTIEGKDDSKAGKPDPPIILENLIKCEAGDCLADAYMPPIILPYGAILTQQQYTSNPVDGSFQVSLGYICTGPCN